MLEGSSMALRNKGTQGLFAFFGVRVLYSSLNSVKKVNHQFYFLEVSHSSRDALIVSHHCIKKINVNVSKWFQQNKLSLNLNKSKVIIFNNCKSNIQETVRIDGINRVHEIKFLGVIIDDRIRYKPHIKYIYTKISQIVSVIIKAKHVLNTKALQILFCSLISPNLVYCTVMWGSTYRSTLKPIFILQKRDIR